jgi:hypothetical protein
MSDPWFNPSLYAWIPGTVFGGVGGLWGALAGILAPQGKGKALVYGMGLTLAFIAVGLFVLGIVALMAGQPYGIWYGLLLPGVLGVVSLAWFPWLVRTRYRQAEEQRMAAKDVSL